MENREAAPYVSVIIPVKDDIVALRRCLSELAAQKRSDGPAYEVIVVDNCSVPPIENADLAGYDVRLVHEPAPGSYRARNTGVRHARGDVLAFTDADCRPDSQWLANAVTALNSTGADAIAGHVHVVFDNTHGRAESGPDVYEQRRAFRQEENVRERGYGVTANLIVRREAYDAAGGFDPKRLSGGDVDFGRRLGHAGRQLEYSAAVAVKHPSRSSLREVLKKRGRVVSGSLLLTQGRPAPVMRYLGWHARRALSDSRSGIADLWRRPVLAARYLVTVWAVFAVTVVTYAKARRSTA